MIVMFLRMKISKHFWMGFLLMAGTGWAEPPKAEPEFEVTPSWDVTCEVFSLPLSEAAKLKRARKTDGEDYAELVKRLESGKVVQEEFLMLRTVEGVGTSVEEISEMIYPTEFEPPELPNKIGNLPEDLEKAQALVTPATPSAFDTKNVGSTMEVELQIAEDDAIEIRMALTLVNYLGVQIWGQGMAETEMPRFAVQSVKTGMKLKRDEAELLGSISPPEAMQPKDGERRVWLAYVTVSESKE